MSRKPFVGNLAYAVAEDDLRTLFSQAGTCEEVAVVTDRETGQSRGFAFVTMRSAEEAERARRELDGTELKGRRLRVEEASEQSPRGGGGARGRPGRSR